MKRQQLKLRYKKIIAEIEAEHNSKRKQLKSDAKRKTIDINADAEANVIKVYKSN